MSRFTNGDVRSHQCDHLRLPSGTYLEFPTCSHPTDRLRGVPLLRKKLQILTRWRQLCAEVDVVKLDEEIALLREWLAEKKSKVSRQRRWQKKMEAAGRCRVCGAQGVGQPPYCAKHLNANRERKRRAAGCSAWRPGGRGRPPITVSTPETLPSPVDGKEVTWPLSALKRVWRWICGATRRSRP